MQKIGDLTATELTQKVLDQSVTRKEIAEFFQPRIENDENNAILAVADDWSSDQKGALSGVPIAVKDNICTLDITTSCSSKILKDFVSVYDATVVEKLKNAGAIIAAKTNCDEFAMGSSNENSAFGVVKNPWDKERVPGGSSGGSAVAVAAGLTPLALGSDTGGSIRQPASYCGVVGYKPSYGSVSRYGLVAFASSLDQIGPFARTVEDAASLYNVICGFDPKDSTSVDRDHRVDLVKIKEGKLAGIKVGVISEFRGTGVDTEVSESVQAAVGCLEDLGATVKEISLPNLKYSVSVYYIIAAAEASANLARFDGIRYGKRKVAQNLASLYEQSRSDGFGREVKQRIMLGTYVLSSGYYDAYYNRANKVRHLIARDFANAFESCDFLVGPVAPTPAFKIGEKTDDTLAMYLNDIFTIGANLAGLPAISVPCGFTKEKLPIGLQIIGPKFADESVFRGAFAYEQANSWSRERAHTN